MKAIFINRLTLVVWFIFASSNIVAKNVNNTSVLYGNSASIGDSIVSITPLYQNGSNVIVDKVLNTVVLSLDTAKTDMPSFDYLLNVTVLIKLYNIGGTLIKSDMVTLSINVNNGDLIKDVYKTNDAHKVVVMLMDVYSDQAVYDYSDFKITNNIESEYHHTQNLITQINTFSTSLISSSNSIKFIWSGGNTQYADEFDVEFTYSDSVTVTGSPKDYYNFRFNSSRTTTTEQEVLIPNLFRRGCVIFRVRAVSYINGDRVESPWSLGTEEGYAQYLTNNVHYYRAAAYEPKKTWTVETIYAEEGKRKTILKHFDGAGYQRQVCTTDNTTNIVLVQEQYYDSLGHEILTTLPAPVGYTSTYSKILKFYKNYNRLNSDTTKTYRREYISNNSCGVAAQLMSMKHGTAKYYSGFNINQTYENAFIPDAEGIPFITMQYALDKTSRMKASGLAGDDLTIGSGHETKIYYGTPFQTQLDRLFGLDVGYSEFYTSTLVKDPNGQLSLSWKDNKGRIIASSLAGASPENVSALASNSGSPTEVDINLLEKNDSSIIQGALTSVYKLTVNSPGLHSFSYTANQAYYTQSGCLPDCYDCSYYIEISVKDECNNEKITGGAIKELLTNTYDSLCQSSSTNPDLTRNFNINLAVGEYAITKKIYVNEASTIQYANLYVKNNTCLKTYQDFYEEEYNKIDFSVCEITCESCIEQLGPLAIFLENNLGTEADYYDIQQNCNMLCGNYELADQCEMAKMAMLEDLRPSGQYAQYLDTNIYSGIIQLNPLKYPLSIFNSDTNNNFLPKNYGNVIRWKNPISPYLDLNGNPSIIILSNGDSILPKNLNSVEEFVNYYKANPQWAYSLLEYHPEYCHYKACLKMRPIREYERRMMNVETFEQALDSGFLNPANWLYNIPGIVPANTSNIDPFVDSFLFRSAVTSSPACNTCGGMSCAYSVCAFKDTTCLNNNFIYTGIYYETESNSQDSINLFNGGTIRRYVPYYIFNYQMQGNSLWDLAAAISNSKYYLGKEGNDGPASGMSFAQNNCSKDEEWKIFRSLYLGKRSVFEYHQMLLLLKTVENCLCDSYYDIPLCQHYSCVDSINIANFYTTKTKRFPDPYENFNIRSAQDFINFYTPIVEEELDSVVYAPPNDTIRNIFENRFVGTKPMDTCACAIILDNNLKFNQGKEEGKYDDCDVNDLLVYEHNHYSSEGEFHEIYNDYNSFKASCEDKLVVSWADKTPGQSPWRENANDELIGENKMVPSYLTCEETDFPKWPIDTGLCRRQLIAQAHAYALNRYEQYIDSVKKDFIGRYKRKCMGSGLTESFNASIPELEYHYTLYYYDQAGNLVKTVPPMGVEKIDDPGTLNDILSDRNGGTYSSGSYTNHSYFSWYKYNTFNQLVEQNTPDGGKSIFFYDLFGRLVASQNAKQETENKYSYTIYDKLNRIIEVGETRNEVSLIDAIVIDKEEWYNWINGGEHTQITKTYYDASYRPHINLLFGNNGQENIRNRITAITYNDEDDTTYNNAIFYSYDVHGNVKTLIRESVELNDPDNRFKRIDYKYDLISGKVLEVLYQDSLSDMFYHKYEYDADNRLTEVYTSADKVMWDRDAEYKYYLHGPLARLEYGDYKLQGLDYAYTINGWLRATNSDNLEVSQDIGKDNYLSPSNPNLKTGVDLYTFRLDYFNDDYVSITGADFLTDINGDPIQSTTNSLYNGNIARSVSSFYYNNQFEQDQMPTIGITYHYDQLNRLLSSVHYLTDAPHSINSLQPSDGAFDETFTYDANGNILHLVRKGNPSNSSGIDMDDLSYVYDNIANGGSVNTNRLKEVDDSENPSDYENDFDGTHFFAYDEIGNLIQDEAEHIDNIEWNVYGKISKIIRTNDTHVLPNLEYRYDGMGNRILKIVKPTINGAEQDLDTWTYTYYVKDATGNVMSIYSRVYESSVAKTRLTEVPVYGSSRIGVYKPNMLVNYDTLSTLIRLDASGSDALFNTASPDANYVNYPYIKAYTWTQSGNVVKIRSLFKFDLTSFPQGATLISAGLSLYGNPEAVNTFEGHTGDNRSKLQRVVTPWNESTVTWNTQPLTTTENQDSLAASSSLKQNYLGVNVLNVVKDMISNPLTSYGFKILHKDEAVFKAMTFVSGDHSDTSKHPKLLLGYITSSLPFTAVNTGRYQKRTGFKNYELSDHLGNVKVVFVDQKQITSTTQSSRFDSGLESWAKINVGDNITWQSATKDISTSGTSIGSGAYKNYSVNSGTKYTFRVDVKSITTSPAQLRIETTGAVLVASQDLNVGSNVITFTASGSSMNIKIVKKNSGGTTTIVFDNTSLHQTYTSYQAGFSSQTDYYSFGSEMPGRVSNQGSYRFGFNGKENDNEVKGTGNSVDFDARIYDPRLGRWLSLDPLQAKYPYASPYNFALNNPINAIDPDGRDVVFVNGFSPHDMNNKFRGGSVAAWRKNNYWNNNNPNFTKNVANYFNDSKHHFLSASQMKGSQADTRQQDGYNTALQMVKSGEIQLSADNPITVVMHSQGNAYGAGFMQGIIDAGKSAGIDVKVNGVMLSVHQPDGIDTKDIADKSIQFTYGNDNSSVVAPMGKVSGVTDANSQNKNYESGGLDAHSATVDKDEAFDAIKKTDKEKKIFTKKGTPKK